MAAKKPKISIRQNQSGEWVIKINNAPPFVIKSIIGRTTSDNKNQTAILFEEGNTVKLFIATLDPPMAEFIPIEPPPTRGFAMHIFGAKNKKEFSVHWRSGKKFHTFRYLFDRLEKEGPISEANARKLLNEDQIRYKSSV